MAVFLLVNVIVGWSSIRCHNAWQYRAARPQRGVNSRAQRRAQAAGTLTGKDRAAAELATFYQDVLPSDLAGARRLTHLRLAQLARESNLKFVRATFVPVLERNRTLTQLKIEMSLSGSYRDMRAFIHELETAPEFVVIDNIELGQGADGGPLSVTLQLSTYYRDAAASRDESQ